MQAMQLEGESNRRDDGLRACNGELERAFCGAQDNVLASNRIEKNMFNVTQAGNAKSSLARHGRIDASGQ